MLALEDARDPRRQAAERLVGGIDDEPVALDLALAEGVRPGVAHGSCFASPSSAACAADARCSRCFLLHRPSEDDPLQAQPPGRCGCPVEGRSAARQVPRRPPLRPAIPLPTSRRMATIRRTMPRRKASAGDVDRHQRACPPDPDPVQGPDRLPVLRPEGAEVVPANQDRRGPRHRGGVERGPHPERITLAKRTSRPVPDGVAVLPVPRRVARVEPSGRASQIADRDVPSAGRPRRPARAPLPGSGRSR